MKKTLLGFLIGALLGVLALSGCASQGSVTSSASAKTTATVVATATSSPTATVSCTGKSCTVSFSGFTPYGTIVVMVTGMPQGVQAADVVGKEATVRDDAKRSYTGAVYSLDNTGNNLLGGFLSLWAPVPGAYSVKVQELNGPSVEATFSRAG